MEKYSLKEDKKKESKNIHSSGNIFRNNIKSIEKENSRFRKRSSSMLLKLNNNYVPKLKPVKAVICPSPYILNQKSPPKAQPEIHNTTVSTASFDSTNEHNLKPIKYIYRRKKPKISFKFLNIEEEAYAISDCEENSKKAQILSDSDSSKSEEEIGKNNKYIINKKYYQNINIMRKKMEKIRKSFIYNENLFDDSEINNRSVGKRFEQFKNIEKKSFISTIRKNRNFIINPLKKIKYRTKSFHIQPKFVPTILGFLEKNNSANSLNSSGK